MPSVLITGASRGIGLEFARQFAGAGWTVLATCRDPGKAGALAAIPGVAVEELDVDDGGSIAALRARIGGIPVDALVNNAGIIGSRARFGGLDYDAWAAAMRTNVLGPLRVAEAFVENVVASERRLMAFVSSRMGSIAQASPGSTVYRSSKAALNMAVRGVALELEPRGVTAVLFHPGHVRTDMGGPSAPVSPEQSVAGMIRVMLGLTPRQSGRFLNYDGSEIPW
jgi:NAD(P)-dependent dehydrogenase (short-subunit alcohol dehydrogenase family)